jgi:hypothetical protein
VKARALTDSVPNDNIKSAFGWPGLRVPAGSGRGQGRTANGRYAYTRANGTVINGTRGPLGPAFASDGYYITIGNSAYHAMEATVRHQSGPLELMAGFTWSKSIDNSPGWSQMINPIDYRLSRTLSTFNVSRNFVLSYHYELPFAHVFGQDRMVRGWILAGITHFADGIPVTLSHSGDRSLLGTGSAGAGSAVDRPHCAVNGDLQSGANDPRTRLAFFNTSIFSRETIGQLGTCSPRIFHGPGLNNFDMELRKGLRLAESKILRFRFEFFNVFNHTQFNNPNGPLRTRILERSRVPAVPGLARSRSNSCSDMLGTSLCKQSNGS